MSRYVETAQPVNKNNFSGDTPTKNEFDTKEGTVKFFEQKLFYNYGTEEQPVIQDVLIEGPLMKSNGIKIKDNGKKISKDIAVTVKGTMKEMGNTCPIPGIAGCHLHLLPVKSLILIPPDLADFLCTQQMILAFLMNGLFKTCDHILSEHGCKYALNA